MTWVGMGYRHELADWIDTGPSQVECLEITAEHFFDGGEDRLRSLARCYPLFVHGLGLSLGTPGPLDAATLDNFARIADIAEARWISEHVAFTRSDEIDLGHLNPIQPTRRVLDAIVEHAREVSQRCGRRLILENITSHPRLDGEMSETEFLNRLCEEADCGLLLDVTNLYINAKNHGFDPRTWLHEIDPRCIEQLHVVGYSRRGRRWQDLHAEPIQDDLYDLIHDVLAYTTVRAVIIERDQNFPPPAELEAELDMLREAVVRMSNVE